MASFPVKWTGGCGALANEKGGRACLGHTCKSRAIALLAMHAASTCGCKLLVSWPAAGYAVANERCQVRFEGPNKIGWGIHWKAWPTNETTGRPWP